MQAILLIAVVFLAVLIQSLVGFGSALIAMGLLVPLIGIQIAAPLVAVLTLTLEIVLVLYFRASIRIGNIWRLVAASVVGIPLGVYFLKWVNEDLLMILLGLVMTGYALYALLRWHLPSLERPAWAYLFGLTAGMLGGAYNTSGPPVIIYGHCRRWDPPEFKGNLQGFFLISSIIVSGTHLGAGSFTPEVIRLVLLSLIPLGVGLLTGLWIEKRIKPETFQKLVLVLLALLGLRLILISLF